MIFYDYGPVADIEIAWTVIAVIGGFFSAFNLRDAIRDLDALGGQRNGRRLIAEVQIRLEAARLTIQAIFATIGVIAMFLPDPPPISELPPSQAAATVVIRWGLIVASSLVMFQSIENRRLRQALHEQYPAAEKGDPA